MRYPQEDAIIWQFDTANFRVICHYFPDMVRQAIAAARVAWHARDNVKLRAA